MPGTTVSSLPGLRNHFNGASDDTRRHFEHLPSLLNGYPLEVAIGYTFHRLEVGQIMALYCGAVKVHRANSVIARSAVNSMHLTRDDFPKLYKTIFDVDVPQAAMTDLRRAEKTRDAIMHGRRAEPKRLRNGIARVVEFAEMVNGQLDGRHGLRPFCGYYRGFAGRLQKLDKRTTRFMLKGIGFPVA